MRRPTPLALLAAVVLAACGSSDGGSASASTKATPADMCKWLEGQGIKSDEGWKENNPGSWSCTGEKLTGDGSGVNATGLNILVRGDKDTASTYQVSLASYGTTAAASTTSNRPALGAAVEELAKKATGKSAPAAVKSAVEQGTALDETKDGDFTWRVSLDQNQDTTGTNPSATRSIIFVDLTFPPKAAAGAASAK